MNTNSKPSALRITDRRVVVASPPYESDYRCLIRIDTNQGIYGYGEVRGRASKTYALMLKSRIMGGGVSAADPPPPPVLGPPIHEPGLRDDLYIPAYQRRERLLF